MRLREFWPLYAKWFVVWLVLLPMLLLRVEYSGAFSSGWVCSLVVGVVFGLCVMLVDRVFFFFCRHRK